MVLNVFVKAGQEFLRLSTKSKIILLVCLSALVFLIFSESEAQANKLKVLTWNVAAINNNPFEYWLTLKDYPKYDQLMNNVESFVLDPPPKRDQTVDTLFTPEMFNRLMGKMAQAKFQDLQIVKEMYEKDWRQRNIISGFLKDEMIGKKRLVSMPDRVTNTIKTSKGTFYRPTPINCYNGPRFTAIHDWFDSWLKFMFDTKVTEDGKVPVQLLEKIPKAKYPAITEEEESVSIPLQTLIIAIFDGIQVRMLNGLAGGAPEWQDLRERICSNLNTKKTDKTIGILKKSYSDATIMFLQETASSFIQAAKDNLGDRYHIIAPQKLGGNDQNSLILLNKRYFQLDSVKEVTQDALSILKKSKSPVVDGDLLVIRVHDYWGKSYLLASFHGDTNGLATIPVVRAVKDVFESSLTSEDRFIFGMDANTYEKVSSPEYQDVTEFAKFFVNEAKLTSCWGDTVSPKKHTTRNARTYMQPQLSKAASKSEIETKGDANPKDFVLFEPKFYRVELVARDNTGNGAFIPGMVFPTLDFPSDHAIVRVVLTDNQ